MPIDPHRKSHCIFVQKSTQACFSHGVVMLENAVQTEDSDLILAEKLFHPIELRDGFGDTSWA
ncbi:MAG: hypothetical protein A4S12_10035 [Proteobacteria bacterium SG_bin5]|nr:MAG: hypothetical protein A4S12_10035 [Proteobacteria bacterium SG_bin5]